MLLKDCDIKQMGSTLIEGYREECVEAISYRITIQSIISDTDDTPGTQNSGEQGEYVLKPLDTVYIKSNEKLHLPDNMAARIVERNSMMRKGLFVSGPHYQPGHHTYIFLRVKNLSSKDYILKSGIDPDEAIAQIEFETLDGPVEKPYGNHDDIYQNEDHFVGEVNVGITETINNLVKNSEKLKKDTKKFQNAHEKLYSEILTLMGVFVAIFSLIIANITSIGDLVNKSIWNILIINASLGLTITGLIGLIMVLLDRADKKRAFILCIIAVLFVLLLIFAIRMTNHVRFSGGFMAI